MEKILLWGSWATCIPASKEQKQNNPSLKLTVRGSFDSCIRTYFLIPGYRDLKGSAIILLLGGKKIKERERERKKEEKKKKKKRVLVDTSGINTNIMKTQAQDTEVATCREMSQSWWERQMKAFK